VSFIHYTCKILISPKTFDMQIQFVMVQFLVAVSAKKIAFNLQVQRWLRSS
jgi:hypothetical protein